MNTLKRFVWIGLAIAMAAVVTPVQAEVDDTNRLSTVSVHPFFSGNWIKDPTIMCPWNVRAEFSGQGWHKFSLIDVARFDFILSISLIEGLEIGADMPLNLLMPEGGNVDEQGIGQVSAYAKYKVLDLDMFDAVVGFEYQADSEDNDVVPCGSTPGTVCAMGFGEPGYNPFVSARATFGDFAAGGHVGYEIFDDPLGDVLNWDVNGIWAPTVWSALRLELTGFNQVSGPSQDIIAIQPGVDFIFDRLTVRLGGAKGITDDAADWTLGGGVAITFGDMDCKEELPPPAPTPAPTPVPEPPAKKRIILRGVNFDFDKSNIRPVDVPVLEEGVKTLKEAGLPGVIAIGYTDSVGTDAYNQKLSERRANSVKTWMVDNGIPAAKITAEGRGETDPVASNETADGRAQNRRVELKVVP